MIHSYLFYLFLFFSSLVLPASSGSDVYKEEMNLPLPDRNRSEERGSHANTPNRNLAGLANHGKQIEDYLAKGIRQNAKRRKLVSGEE